MPLETTNAFTAKLAMEYCKKTLKLVDENYSTELSRSINYGRVSIADYVFYSLLQFLEVAYSVNLLCAPELPILQHLRRMI